MSPADTLPDDLSNVVRDLRAGGTPFAIATVIRTVGATAARPGDKAILDADGTIIEGWVGGGCVRAALARAVQEAVASGAPQLISLAPQELLAEKGIEAGSVVDGVRFARNGCPSKGSLDIFVEPDLPMPELLVLGGSPVAEAIGALAVQFQWVVRRGDAAGIPAPLPVGGRRMAVVASQGKDDMICLTQALQAEAEYVGFVASRRKWLAMAGKLREAGVDERAIKKVDAPAGVAINAVTPDEIALSILAGMTRLRRQDQRAEGAGDV